MSFPRDASAANGSAPEKPAPAGRVLVLDEDLVARAESVVALTRGGFVVVCIEDPREAASRARDGSVDLVLADLAMAVIEAVPRWERRRTDPRAEETPPPMAEGYAVLKPLLIDPSCARFPLVFLQGDDGGALRSAAFRFGVVDYIPKPADPQTLARVARSALERSSALPPSADDIGSAAFDAVPEVLRTALVVDPETESRRTVHDLLVGRGFTVHQAASGEEGLRLALEKRPWLILSEVTVPGLDGFELCRRVRGHSLLHHTPFVFLSGRDDYRDRYHGLRLGADDFLAKATGPRELLIRIQLLLKRYSEMGARNRRGAGMEGAIDVVGAPGMLQMCHLGRLTGVCTVRTADKVVQIRFNNGDIVSADSDTSSGVDAVYDVLAWSRGHFEFVPGDPGAAVPLGATFDQLLLEGCRRLDEARRAPDAAMSFE
jgi:DNA-binding response OmpR family regulator